MALKLKIPPPITICRLENLKISGKGIALFITKSMPNGTRFLLQILPSKDVVREHLTSHEFINIQGI